MATPTMSLKKRLEIIDEAIERKKMIADGHPVRAFTTQDNMIIYDCVYTLCTSNPPAMDCARQIYDKYINCLKERITERVLPSVADKNGTGLLVEVTKWWSEIKAFANSLSKLFAYLDQFYIPRKGLVTLNHAPKHYFCDLVCDKLYGRLQEATMSLILQEREGNPIDRDLLKSVLKFFVEMENEGSENYHGKFEQIILAEAAAYYSQLSLEWWFWRDSLANYLRKVDWCLVQEEGRAEVYPCETTRIKLLQVLRYILLERNAKKLAQMQKAECHNLGAEDQQLVAKYTSLNLGGDSSAAVGDILNGVANLMA